MYDPGIIESYSWLYTIICTKVVHSKDQWILSDPNLEPSTRDPELNTPTCIDPCHRLFLIYFLWRALYYAIADSSPEQCIAPRPGRIVISLISVDMYPAFLRESYAVNTYKYIFESYRNFFHILSMPSLIPWTEIMSVMGSNHLSGRTCINKWPYVAVS